ncbi:MAG TPA: macro domain-containing protein [Candidatus Saccharimonadales bacterium]|nr:macro domain-containing protein [Candidatus Saccharimonadales bacterium]
MQTKTINADITELEVDAIVNAANTGLVGGSGVCGAIHDGAGPELDEECSKLGGCLRGEAKITKGYKLPAKYIIHTVGPIYGQHKGKEEEILYSCYYESLRLADENNIKSIAFPEISTGIYCYPKEEARRIARTALEEYFEDNLESGIEEVWLVEYEG